MEVGNCKKIDACSKIKAILDKDMLDVQYADAIRSVCSLCKVKEVQNINR
jgi:hypothetical protein